MSRGVFPTDSHAPISLHASTILSQPSSRRGTLPMSRSICLQVLSAFSVICKAHALGLRGVTTPQNRSTIFMEISLRNFRQLIEESKMSRLSRFQYFYFLCLFSRGVSLVDTTFFAGKLDSCVDESDDT